MNQIAETSQIPALTVSAGTTIAGCGTAGAIVQGVIRASVDWLLIFNPSAYGVHVECTSTAAVTSTRVAVEAPLGNRHTDIFIRDDGMLTVLMHFPSNSITTPAGSNVCVIVEAGASCTGLFATPLNIEIPLGTGTVPGSLVVNVFGTPCVSVQVNLPSCGKVGMEASLS